MPTAQTLLIAALSGVLTVGAKTAGMEAAKGTIYVSKKVAHLVHKPAQAVACATTNGIPNCVTKGK